MSSSFLILVDEQDNQVGICEKMQAHEKGLMHRAFSVFLFNKKGEMLLQQRAIEKYHSGGLWTNTCCSHPYPGETTLDAANRRLHEELGICADICEVFDFSYRAEFSNGLIENEFDHVFVGEFEGEIAPNTHEVMAVKYVAMHELETELQNNAAAYTAWFQIAFPKIKHWWLNNHKK